MLPSRAALLAASVVAAAALLAAPAGAAQRHYRVVSGTTTITFHDAWLATLGAASVQFAGVDGTKVTATPRKDRTPIVRASFPVRVARGDGLVYGMPGGTSVTVTHRGGLAFSNRDRPGTVAFRRPRLVVAGASKRIDGDLPVAGGERTPWLRIPSARVPSPRGGEVRITMRDVRWDYTGWMVFGATPSAPPTDVPWFPKAAMGAPVGDVVTTLVVRRR